MMGFFAVYNGLLYNECFAIPLDLFQTNWQLGAVGEFGKRINEDRTYPFGVDPVWGIAANNLVYYNSLKMKLSIVFGVAQMVFGIILSGTNAWYFRRWVDIVFVWIPQMIFMCFLFGYLWLIIFIKWFTDYSQRSNDAPALIPLFIQFFMSPSKVAKSNFLYEGQEGVQPFLVITAIIMLPIMLIAKPVVLKLLYNRKVARHEIHTDPHTGHAKPFPMGEIITHNSIHTIEFVLGCISNTASYLRLWALSLAHSELAKVFYEKVLVTTMQMPAGFGWLATYVGFAFFAGATFGVIVMMECLSALLHALRLHWVEFQNKFYSGNGKPFLPFSFKKILATDEI
jgi:V-type H+-transporting ATPase subunit a